MTIPPGGPVARWPGGPVARWPGALAPVPGRPGVREGASAPRAQPFAAFRRPTGVTGRPREPRGREPLAHAPFVHSAHDHREPCRNPLPPS
ncbi:hypothetical protein ACFV4T_11845 [Streptomyces sp. NPDC059755]|uniref:hypothetical protein n=1 Tax=Streptomyces sp. NPDC059755 TaxID=3346934 RepID=UPI003650C96B